MKIHIITVGQPKLAYAQAGWAEYIGRLKHYHSVRITHIADKHADSEHMRSAAGTAYVVALVIDAQQLSSSQLARFIEERNQDGREVAFLIGGPDGLPSDIIDDSHYLWSLSRLTFPHDLAMVIVAETLYRASTIVSAQPYHR